MYRLYSKLTNKSEFKFFFMKNYVRIFDSEELPNAFNFSNEWKTQLLNEILLDADSMWWH